MDSSHVYSNLPIGNYHRYLIQANYDITFSKSGYYPKTINATILNNIATVRNVQLVPINTTPTAITEVIGNDEENLFIDILGRKNKQIKNNIQLITKENSVIKKQIIIE
jgi:hypothetical protein